MLDQGGLRLPPDQARDHGTPQPRVERALYADVRGLTTRRLHQGTTTFEIAIDFVDNLLTVRG